MPGQKLPTEEKICRRFKIFCTAARQVYGELAKLGILVLCHILGGLPLKNAIFLSLGNSSIKNLYGTNLAMAGEPAMRSLLHHT